MKRIKSLLAAFTAMTMAAPLVLSVVAETVDEEYGYVYVSVANAGTIEVADQMVELYDADGDGQLTVNDAIITTHDWFYDGGADAGYKTKTTEWGESIVKLWGVENGGSYGYTVNDQFASGLSDPLTDGDNLTFYVYQDAEHYSDVYTYFDIRRLDGPVLTNETVTLSLRSIVYDENWVPQIKPVEGARIIIDGVHTDFVTNENGKVDINFDGHIYDTVVSAECDDMIIVPPVARFNVWDAEWPLTTDVTTTTGYNHYHFAAGHTDIGIGETGYLSICGDLESQFEIEDESIARIVRSERGTVYFEGVSEGETTLTATCGGWGTTSETIRVFDPATTTTQEPVFTTTQNDVTYATTTGTTTYGGRETHYTNTTITFPYEEPNPISFDLAEAEMEAGDELTLTIYGYEDSNVYAPGESPIRFWLLDNYAADIVQVQGMSVTIKAWEAGGAVVHAQTPDGRTALSFVQIKEKYVPGTTDPYDYPQTTTTTTSTTNACGTFTGYGTTTTATTTGYDFYYFVPPTNREICVGELGSLSIVGGIDSDFEVETEGVIEVLSTNGGTITFRGIAPGETVITAHSKGGSYTATAVVDVIDPASTTTFTTQTTAAYTGFTTTTTAVTTGNDFYYFVPPTYREICVGELGSLSIVGGIDSDFEVETEGVIEVLSTNGGTITFRGIAPGETVITAHSKGGSYTATAVVDVIDPASTTTFTTQTTAAYTGFTTTTSAIGGTDHDFILTSSTDPDYYIGTTSAFVTDEYHIDEESTTTTTETTITGHHIHFLSERTTVCVNETAAFSTCGGESADFWIEDESIAEIIEEESDFYNGYVVIRGLQPGETVLYGEGFDGTAIAYITVREAATTPVVTGTEITGTTTVTTETEPVFTTTIAGGVSRPDEDLPQTGNNDMSGMLGLICALAITGTGFTVLRQSGILKDEEE